MRYAFFVGGFAGFLVTAVAGFLADRPTEAVFRDAAIGCLVVAFLFRWFWSVLVKVFIEAVQEHRRQGGNAKSPRGNSTPASGSPAVQP